MANMERGQPGDPSLSDSTANVPSAEDENKQPIAKGDLSALSDEGVMGSRECVPSTANGTSPKKNEVRLPEELAQFSETASGVHGVSGKEPFPSIEGYEITARLGAGGMGTVWLATQLGTQRQVALKLLTAGAFGSAKSQARFEREVELAAGLEHPNIARVYESSLRRGTYAYAMEYIDGVHLDRYVRDNNLTPRQILRLIQTIARAVQQAHQRGVIHRDIKPSNVLVTADGKPFILDFGLAKEIDEAVAKGATISIDGEVAGTPTYMSPEQAAGQSDRIDTRSDVYSLGVMLYQLLTGLHPHGNIETRYELLRRIAEDEVRRPREVSKKVDIELEALLLKALALMPEDRYASAGELADDIENYLSGDPLSARKPTFGYFLRKKIRKHRVPVSIAAAVLVALLSLAAFSYIRVTQERNRAEAARKTAQAAQEETTRQRDIATKQKVFAEKAKKIAELEKNKAMIEVKKNRRLTYVSTFRLANSEYQQKRFAGAGKLLSTCPVEFRNWEWSWLWEKTHDEIRTFKRHVNPVYSLVVAPGPDGEHIISASGDKDHMIIKRWDVDTGAEIRSFKLRMNVAREIVFSPDGKRLVSTSRTKIPKRQDDGYIVKLWDMETGEEIRTLREPADDMWCGPVIFSPDSKRIVWSCGDKTVLCNAINGEEIRIFETGGVAFSPDSKWIVSGGGEGTMKFWNANTGEEIRTLKGQKNWGNPLAVSPDGKLIASGSRNKTFKIWNRDTGEEIQTFACHTHIGFVVFCLDGKLVVSKHLDDGPMNGKGEFWNYTLVFWNVQTGEKIRTIKKQSPVPMDVVFSPDGKQMALGVGNTLELWDVKTGEKTRIFKGHTGSIWSVAFSPDGTRVVSGSTDTTIKIWDAQIDDEIKTFEGHKGWIYSVVFSPDGKRAASVGWGDGVKFWDIQTGKEIRTLKGLNTVQAGSVAFSPDGKQIVLESRNSLSLLNVKTGEEIWKTTRKKNAHLHPLPRFTAFSPDGKRIISRGYHSIELWDTKTGKQIRTIEEMPGHIYVAGISPDGRRFLTIELGDGAGHILSLWDMDTDEKIWMTRVPRHLPGAWPAAFSPDGKKIILAPLKLLDANTGMEILMPKGHRRLGTAATFSPDGKWILSGSAHGTIRFWDANTGGDIRTLRGHKKLVSALAFSPDGEKIISGSKDGTLKLWDARGNREQIRTFRLKEGESQYQSVVFSQDHKLMASCSGDGALMLWDAQTGKKMWPHNQSADSIDSYAPMPPLAVGGEFMFSTDENNIVVGSASGIDLYSIDGCTSSGLGGGPADTILSLAISSDGKRVVSGCRDNTVWICDEKNSKASKALKGHKGKVAAVAFSPDGKRVISGSEDKTLRFWNALTGKEIGVLKGHMEPISAVAFSPNAKWIVSGDKAGAMKLWDVAMGKEIRMLKGHTGKISSVVFSPDGKRIISGSKDKTLKLWDTETGKELLTLDEHTDAVKYVAFSPDGLNIVSADIYGTVIIREAADWRKLKAE